MEEESSERTGQPPLARNIRQDNKLMTRMIRDDKELVYNQYTLFIMSSIIFRACMVDDSFSRLFRIPGLFGKELLVTVIR